MKNAQVTTGADRILSLDVFRGLTMAFMVLVGNPGSNEIYPQLDHAPWHGWTITDLVFPTFLWIVGFSIQLSFTRQTEKGRTGKAMKAPMLKRCLLLFSLGIGIYAISDWHLETFRVLGVLQRIAVCSAIVSLLYPLSSRKQIIIAGSILCGYAALLRWVPAPGHPPGDLSIEGNLAHFIDRIVLARHNYSGTGDWDPEGLLSTIPAIATTLMGMLAAKLLLKLRQTGLQRGLQQMVAIGSSLLIAGYVIGLWQPINKKLWTPAFCLFCAGFDFLVFPLLYWLIDHWQMRRNLTVPLAFGQNALAIYLFSECIGALLYRIHLAGISLHEMIFRSTFAGMTTPRGDSLLFALSFLAVVTMFAYVAYRKRWILKL